MKNQKYLIITIPVIIEILIETLLTVLSLLLWDNYELSRFICGAGKIIVASWLIYKYSNLIKMKFKIDKVLLYSFLIGTFYFSVENLIKSYFVAGYSIPHLAAYTAISAILIAPVAEEILFRGWMMGYLIEKKTNTFVTVFISSLIFGLIHILNGRSFNTTLLFKSFILGCVLGTVYLKTKNLLHPILIHFTFNLLTVLLGFFC
jgi:membrane protease YdiL (CAAX protease family)